MKKFEDLEFKEHSTPGYFKSQAQSIIKMEETFKIKDNSVQEFIDKYILHKESRRDTRDTCNPYYVFGKEEIIVRGELAEDYNLNPDHIFEIQLLDHSQGANRELINTYTYELTRNDTISDKLVLMDFKIELK